MKCNLNALNTYPFEYIKNISNVMNLKCGEYWEISEKRFVKTLSKIRKFSKNCSAKIKLPFIAKDL